MQVFFLVQYRFTLSVPFFVLLFFPKELSRQILRSIVLFHSIKWGINLRRGLTINSLNVRGRSFLSNHLIHWPLTSLLYFFFFFDNTNLHIIVIWLLIIQKISKQINKKKKTWLFLTIKCFNSNLTKNSGNAVFLKFWFVSLVNHMFKSFCSFIFSW